MINALIFATFAFTVLYISAAFAHHCSASICRRHKEKIVHVCEVSDVNDRIATEKAEEVTSSVELPDSIRGLRQFVRENTLQTRVKSITGKSVSTLSKGELRRAVMVAIA